MHCTAVQCAVQYSADYITPVVLRSSGFGIWDSGGWANGMVVLPCCRVVYSDVQGAID